MARSPSLLETTENTRDLGGHTAPDGRVTRYHVLLRSDVPREPSSRDVTYLREHGIDTIIDLRESSATERDGSFFAERDGFHCCPCPIPEGSGIPASPAAVPESYMGIVESPGTASALAAMADAPGGVLFHCTAGKDRTGVISAVVLLLCGVPREEIVADYVLSAQCLRGRLGEVHRRFPQLDMAIVTPLRMVHAAVSLPLPRPLRRGGRVSAQPGDVRGADLPSSGQIVIENWAVLWDGPVFLFMLPAAFDKGGWKDARRQR